MAQKKATQKVSSQKTMSGTWYLIIGLVMVIGVILALVFIQPKETQLKSTCTDYNNFQFTQQPDGLWMVRIDANNQAYRLTMHYPPCELEDIAVQENFSQYVNRFVAEHHQLNNKQIYISVRPDASSELVIAGVEIAKIMGERYGILDVPTRSAISRPMENLTGYPVVTCWDANEDTMVIWIKEEGENLIVSPQANCLVIQGNSSTDTIKVADRFVYGLLGIMP